MNERPKNVVDLVGFRNTYTEVIEYIERRGAHHYWKVQCVCGAIKELSTSAAKQYQSCGCKRAELLASANTKHGMSGGWRGKHPKIYRTWAGMLSRCSNSKLRCYADYGGRGIVVCERWHDFSVFLEDMGMPPTAEHSIDRIDNNGNYEPGNCRWATNSEQSRNRSDNRYLEFDGQRKIVADWAKDTGLSEHLISSRLDVLGWTVERALTEPPGTSLGGCPGESHHKAKVTEDDVRAIRAARESGETAANLARKYGMQGAAISKICKRQLWKNVN